MTTDNKTLWGDNYKIPWNDPAFSQRMLEEHLSQHHDLASRRVEWIDNQVIWLHEAVLQGQPARILDLGCGPGFYSHRLSALGHHCHGIDFGPASVVYAQEHTPHAERTEFTLGDIREMAYGGPYDLAMLLYGELNVFSPDEVVTILRNAYASLAPGGRLLIEAHTPEAVEAIGRGDVFEQELESGLFSDRPHGYRIENEWFPGEEVARQCFLITDREQGGTTTYYSTTKAWSDEAFNGVLEEAGFRAVRRCEDWPSNSEALQLWIAERD